MEMEIMVIDRLLFNAKWAILQL